MALAAARRKAADMRQAQMHEGAAAWADIACTLSGGKRDRVKERR